MRFFVFAFFLALPACQLSNCSKPTERAFGQAIDFPSHFSISHEFDPARNTLKINVLLAPGFHAYAQGEKIGRPVSLAISPLNGWAPKGEPQIPTGKRLSLGSLGESVVLEGKFAIIQPLRPGNGPGEASLALQVCTQAQCDRPRVHPIRWP